MEIPIIFFTNLSTIILGDTMKHEIDLSKYQIRTDLAIDSFEQIKDGIEEYKENDIKITVARLDQKMGQKIGKKEGIYITLEFDDVTDVDNRKNIIKTLEKYLRILLKEKNITEKQGALVIGLGNSSSTPDALGPLVVKDTVVTNHLFMLSQPEEGIRPVCAFTPGVMGQTGIETSELIKSTIKTIQPDFLIVIDALASSSLSRLNKTIQISDAGIHPGSGVGNNRKEISEKEVGVPVIAIGVPTVVDAVTLVSDTFNYMHKHYAFHKNFQKKPSSKFVSASNVNYLKENNNLNSDDKQQLLGIVGSLEDNEIKELLFEVLTPIGYNLMVTPKEIDFLIENLSKVISKGINSSLHNNTKIS